MCARVCICVYMYARITRACTYIYIHTCARLCTLARSPAPTPPHPPPYIVGGGSGWGDMRAHTYTRKIDENKTTFPCCVFKSRQNGPRLEHPPARARCARCGDRIQAAGRTAAEPRPGCTLFRGLAARAGCARVSCRLPAFLPCCSTFVSSQDKKPRRTHEKRARFLALPLSIPAAVFVMRPA